MTDIEIPLGKRSKSYRFFEMLPAIVSIGAVVLLFILSWISSLAGAIYVLALVLLMFVRAVAIAFRTIQGRVIYQKTRDLPWRQWLNELEDPAKFFKRRQSEINSKKYKLHRHILNLERLAELPEEYPRPSQIVNVDLIAFYNESYDVLRPTLETLARSNYDIKHNLIVVIAYEERGGQAALDTVLKIKQHWRGVFRDILFVKHPKDLPHEVVGKGANLTCAGKFVMEYARAHHLDPKNIIVTSQDCDNHPEPNYLAYLTYEWIITPNRQRTAFQPICLFNNNIWDAAAPMRVIAMSNSFWNMISTMRPHTLRNFASHAQGLEALSQMNFWSTRTVVEDGHQYWRSYFFFDGDYAVVPLRIGIGQDAVLAGNFRQTLWAQFKQIRRWAYGCSDVPYVVRNLFRRDRTVPFWSTFARLCRIFEGYITQAFIAPIVAFGAWIPLFFGRVASRSFVAHELPLTISHIQNIAIVGLFITAFASLTILPRRPQRYRRARVIWMLLQWILAPIVAVIYSSVCAYTAQMMLATGHYMNKFDVTKKLVKK
jgi:hypothetical protein